jgi:hypothetical protein
MALQLTLPGDIAGRKNPVVIGGSADFGRARFTRDKPVRLACAMMPASAACRR